MAAVPCRCRPTRLSREVVAQNHDFRCGVECVYLAERTRRKPRQDKLARVRLSRFPKLWELPATRRMGPFVSVLGKQQAPPKFPVLERSLRPYAPPDVHLSSSSPVMNGSRRETSNDRSPPPIPPPPTHRKQNLHSDTLSNV